MNVWIGRVAGAIASAVIVFLLDVLGLPVTDEQRAGLIQWLSDGLTMIGGIIFVALYGIFHKLIDKRLNPNDTAVPTSRFG